MIESTKVQKHKNIKNLKDFKLSKKENILSSNQIYSLTFKPKSSIEIDKSSNVSNSAKFSYISLVEKLKQLYINLNKCIKLSIKLIEAINRDFKLNSVKKQKI